MATVRYPQRRTGTKKPRQFARSSAMEHVDGLRPARLTIGIISAGRVGTALGLARQRAERRLPDTAVLPPDQVAARAELLLLAVPDAELAGLVSGLAATSAVRPGAIVAHTS